MSPFQPVGPSCVDGDTFRRINAWLDTSDPQPPPTADQFAAVSVGGGRGIGHPGGGSGRGINIPCGCRPTNGEQPDYRRHSVAVPSRRAGILYFDIICVI